MSRESLNDLGFTLIELMVSLAMLSLILGAIYSTFFLSHRAIDGMEDSLLRLRECRMTLDLMSREADSLLYNYKPDLSGKKTQVFKVEDRDIFGNQTSRVVFTSFSPLVQGLSRVSYYVEEKDGKLTLFKKIGSAFKEHEAEKGVEVTEGIRSFLFEVREGDKWIRTWDSDLTKKLPEEIRITIVVLIKDRPVALYETIRPKIGRSL